MKPWSLSVVSLICLSTVCIKMRKLNAASITDTATGPYTDTDTDTDTCQLGCGYKCLWPGPNALMCVHFNLYKRTRKKGVGIIKGKTGRIRTNQDELVPSFVEPGKRCGCSCCCRYYCLRPCAVVIAVFAIFMPGQSQSLHIHKHTHTHQHTHTHTCRETWSTVYGMQIPHGFSIFSNHFHGLSTTWAFVRALCGFTDINKANNCGPPRILALIETLLRTRTMPWRPDAWILMSWWSERVCGFLLPISASLPIVASPHLASSHPIRSTIHHWHWFPIPCPAASLLRCPTGLPSLFPGFVVAASGMHIVHLNWSRNGVGRVSFKVILLLCEGTHLRWNSVDDSDKLSPMFRTFKHDHTHMDYWIW